MKEKIMISTLMLLGVLGAVGIVSSNFASTYDYKQLKKDIVNSHSNKTSQQQKTVVIETAQR